MQTLSDPLHRYIIRILPNHTDNISLDNEGGINKCTYICIHGRGFVSTL
jgi:hypothetical protein